ncbi:threonine/serine exporter family protein [uncultured Akkermansia sp.]|nr:threonine/serine exporter family protein [uncultured Akkermansia sp.]
MLGFLAKQQLTRLKYNPLGVIILSAFTASMAAACAVLFQIGSTPQIALAASVLFLVPGVQMINSIMDLMHGHILMGISRGVHSIMMIVCIAIGLSATMLIVGVNSL